VHYENNSPFLTVTQMTRVIEVSHWGNIAIEETYDLVHSGAVLKGPFSRYDYQRHQDGISSVKSFKVSTRTRSFKFIFLCNVVAGAERDASPTYLVACYYV